MEQTKAAATAVRLMAFDVDGVMTNGQLYYTASGESVKAFCSQDGHGIKMLQNAGIVTAIISGRSSAALTSRATGLGISHLHMGVDDKRSCMVDLLRSLNLSPEQAGYMGDDVPDLPVLRYCGFSAAPADAHPFVKAHVRYICKLPGGGGAVREACDFILSAQNRLDAMLAAYLL